MFLSCTTVSYHTKIVAMSLSRESYDIIVVLANVYAPNMDDVGFFECLFSSFSDLTSYTLILGGDFNCWLDPVLDRSSPKSGTLSRLVSFIQNFLSNYGISDEWRCLNPHKREFCFFSQVHHTFSRIDYFLINNQLLPSVRSCDYRSIVILDHAPVTMSLSLPGLPKTRKHWCFNSTLLSDFVTFMEEQITFFFDTNTTPDTSSLIVWDALKAYLWGQMISYTVNMKSKANTERQEL